MAPLQPLIVFLSDDVGCENGANSQHLPPVLWKEGVEHVYSASSCGRVRQQVVLTCAGVNPNQSKSSNVQV